MGTRLAVVVGALGSAALTLYAGRRNPSTLLILIFVAWVSAPFAGLWLTRRRPLMVAVPLACLLVYGSMAFNVVHAKLGFVFLMFPLACWAAIGAAVAMRRRKS
jgi:hypothetical protein